MDPSLPPSIRPRPCSGTGPRQLVLVGSGVAHATVLAAVARERWPDVAVTLVAPARHWMHPALGPGWMAGRWSTRDCVVPMADWADRAGARWVAGRGIDLDAGARQLRVATTEGAVIELAYDRLSLDLDGDAIGDDDADARPGAAAHTHPVEPLAALVPVWREILADAADHRLSVAVVGSTLQAMTVAVAVRRALPADRRVLFVDDGPWPIGLSAAVRERGWRRLAHQGVVRCPGLVSAYDEEGIWIETPAGVGTVRWHLACDAVLRVAPKHRPPAWLAVSGLRCDAAGHVEVDADLRSRSHQEVHVLHGHTPAWGGRGLSRALGWWRERRVRASLRAWQAPPG